MTSRVDADRFYTYIHCKPDSTPFYVGKGVNYRAYEFSEKRRNRHYSNIIRKYGEQNILVYLFYCASEKEALEDEVVQIHSLRAQGYILANITDGGDGVSGYIHTEEAKLKISKSKIGTKRKPSTIENMRNANIGKTLTEETKAKIKEAMIGRQFSDEHRGKIAAASRSNKAFLGRNHSEETKEKIRAKITCIVRSEESKKNMSVAQKRRFSKPVERTATGRFVLGT